ncbi:conserved hypothetical protein [Mesorhizobium ventifaucium]|uniref:DNA-binding protein n=1 Tax=Mesorhizobium ventifaucium TaxID=666020 RepID=A0ABN8KCQ0_9HYPH|nr:conserved hypothetical protein [Mesorhizobium ventifaucium]
MDNDKIYTIGEAADLLRLTNRGVAKIARRHGLCMVAGRNILLTGKDVEAIKDTLRVEPSLPRRHVEPRSSDYQMYKSLQRLLAPKPKSPGRIRWEKTHAKQSAEREATKASLVRWKDAEPLDRTNRDQAYWTPERKERLRLERLARKKGWAPQND